EPTTAAVGVVIRDGGPLDLRLVAGQVEAAAVRVGGVPRHRRVRDRERAGLEVHATTATAVRVVAVDRGGADRVLLAVEGDRTTVVVGRFVVGEGGAAHRQGAARDVQRPTRVVRRVAGEPRVGDRQVAVAVEVERATAAVVATEAGVVL